MWKKLFAATDTYRRMPRDVHGIRIEQVGSKYCIYADVEGQRAKAIGRYNTLQEAQAAFELIKNITNSNK